MYLEVEESYSDPENVRFFDEYEYEDEEELVEEEEFPPCVTPAFNGEDQVSSNIIYIALIYCICIYCKCTRYVLLLILTSS